MKPQHGPTTATTSKIGLGGAFIASSFADGVATVQRALELMRYFDTSPMYCQGASQAVFGAALEGVTEDYLLATKLGYFAEPSRYHSRAALITQCEENLRLRRARVDTLQPHEADFHHWWSTDDSVQGRVQAEREYSFNDAPALTTLRELKAQGRCRFIGISGNTADKHEPRPAKCRGRYLMSLLRLDSSERSGYSARRQKEGLRHTHRCHFSTWSGDSSARVFG